MLSTTIEGEEFQSRQYFSCDEIDPELEDKANSTLTSMKETWDKIEPFYIIMDQLFGNKSKLRRVSVQSPQEVKFAAKYACVPDGYSDEAKFLDVPLDELKERIENGFESLPGCYVAIDIDGDQRPLTDENIQTAISTGRPSWSGKYTDVFLVVERPSWRDQFEEISQEEFRATGETCGIYTLFTHRVRKGESAEFIGSNFDPWDYQHNGNSCAHAASLNVQKVNVVERNYQRESLVEVHNLNVDEEVYLLCRPNEE
jgi:hypothetical protein